jgi:hypothetical protein
VRGDPRPHNDLRRRGGWREMVVDDSGAQQGAKKCRESRATIPCPAGPKAWVFFFWFPGGLRAACCGGRRPSREPDRHVIAQCPVRGAHQASPETHQTPRRMMPVYGSPLGTKAGLDTGCKNARMGLSTELINRRQIETANQALHAASPEPGLTSAWLAPLPAHGWMVKLPRWAALESQALAELTVGRRERW